MPPTYLSSLDREAIEARFRPVFHPRSIAIVGASSDPGAPGHRFVKTNVEFGFENVYPINPSAEEIRGLPAYDSVLDVPDEIDLAIVVLRAEVVPDVLEECGEKGIEAVHVMSSGFSEVDTEEGRRLEDRVERVADRYGITVIGPNSIGIYSPGANLGYIPTVPEDPGSVAFVSHSGGFTIDLASRGRLEGLRFSKVVSVGNGTNTGIVDLFEYLVIDEETDLIALYLEGLEDRVEGRRLFELAREAVPETPVVAMKGGHSDRGSEATRSHTGSLAGSYRVWQGMFEQAGIAEVDSFEELVDTVKLFSAVDAIEGNRAALIGPGGGTSVTAIDACSAAGIDVPEFGDETVAELLDLDTPRPGNVSNPIDAPLGVLSVDEGRVLRTMAEIATDDPRIDSLIVHLNVNHLSYHSEGETLFENMVSGVREFRDDTSIPVLVVFRNPSLPDVIDTTQELWAECSEAGIPVFASVRDAATALRHLVDYRAVVDKA